MKYKFSLGLNMKRLKVLDCSRISFHTKIDEKNIETKKAYEYVSLYLWSHLGSNQGPPDYESGALTN